MKQINDLYHLIQILVSKKGAADSAAEHCNIKSTYSERIAYCKGESFAYNTIINLLLSYLKYNAGNKIGDDGIDDELFELIKWIKTNKVDIKELKSIYENNRKKDNKNE